jgi:hypothetical protein
MQKLEGEDETNTEWGWMGGTRSRTGGGQHIEGGDEKEDRKRKRLEIHGRGGGSGLMKRREP